MYFEAQEMKLRTKIVFRIYQVLRSLRYQLLFSVFGVVSHCNHKPTCGSYLIKQIEQRGLIVGGFMGARRVLKCW